MTLQDIYKTADEAKREKQYWQHAGFKAKIVLAGKYYAVYVSNLDAIRQTNPQNKKEVEMKLLGYRDGFSYYRIKNDVFRADYADENPHDSLRWYSTFPSFQTSIKAYGPLFNAEGRSLTNINGV